MNTRWKPSTTVAAIIERDGRYLLLSIWANDGALIVYDSQTLKEIKRIAIKGFQDSETLVDVNWCNVAA